MLELITPVISRCFQVCESDRTWRCGPGSHEAGSADLKAVSGFRDPGVVKTGTDIWHTPTPAVYLDQWVWVRFARVVGGKPHELGDAAVLDAVVAAAQRGVLFPLSTTHYEETLRIRDPRQRQDLMTVMAPVSQMYTLRSQGDLVRHQLLAAMHDAIGRPTFRPPRPRVFGRGFTWAFSGVDSQMRVVGPDDSARFADTAWLRHATQYFEAQMLRGPTDEEIPELSANGYLDLRSLESRSGNRLAWEELFAKQLAGHSPKPSRLELRAWLLGRELTHEYSENLTRTLMEYRLTFASLVGGAHGSQARQRAVEFAERVPTLRISAEMKLEMFRNPSRRWTQNMVRDIDAISLALPYCRAVVGDRDAMNLLRRSHAPVRYGSLAVHELAELPEVLAQIKTEDASSEDLYSWDCVGPGEGFRIDPPKPLDPGYLCSGARVRLCGPKRPIWTGL